MELIFIVLLILASIVGVTFIVERGLALRWHKIIPPAVEAAVETCRSPEDLPILRHACELHPSPLSRLLVLADSHGQWPKSENAEAVQGRARYEIVRLERGLVFLEIIVGIAPLLGLVGTVYGLIMLFGTLGPGGMSDHSNLSRGIATALYATLLGLLAAIPSLIAWSYYNKKIETVSVEMESLCDEFLKRYYNMKPRAEELAKADDLPRALKKQRV